MANREAQTSSVGVAPFTEIFECHPFMSFCLDIAEQCHVVAFISAVSLFACFFSYAANTLRVYYSQKPPRDGSTAFNILCAQSALSGASVSNTSEPFIPAHSFTSQ